MPIIDNGGVVETEARLEVSNKREGLRWATKNERNGRKEPPECMAGANALGKLVQTCFYFLTVVTKSRRNEALFSPFFSIKVSC